jgi:hypothetical protein
MLCGKAGEPLILLLPAAPLAHNSQLREHLAAEGLHRYHPKRALAPRKVGASDRMTIGPTANELRCR